MASFVARSCTPNPRIDVLAIAPETGATLRSTTYRGLLDVSVDTNKGPTMTEGTLDATLPDCLPHQSSQASAGSSVASTVVPVGIDPIAVDVRTSSRRSHARARPARRGSGACRHPAGLATPVGCPTWR